MKSHEKKDYKLHSVKNAMRILRLFSWERPELGVTEISRLLELNKSTVYHLMSFLTADGFLEKGPKSRYRLGLVLLQLSGIITTQMEIHREALPILEQLVEELGETAYIGILEGSDVAYLHKVECKFTDPILSYIGKRNPAFRTGSGKAILAYQRDEIIEEVVDSLPSSGPHSIADHEQFKQQLKQIRSQGHVIVIDGMYEGFASISVPVRDYTNKVVAAISIVGPTERIRDKGFPYAIETLKNAGREISTKLGYYS